LRDELGNPCANDTTVIGEPDASAFEKVSDGGGGLIHIPAGAADREDEVAEREG